MSFRCFDEAERSIVMSVDGESCPSCDVLFDALQFRPEDSIARSVVVCLQDVVLCFAPVVELASSCCLRLQ